jgi:hypothetical protein
MNLEGSGHELLEVLSWCDPEGQENHENSCQGTRCPAEIRTEHFSNGSCLLGSTFVTWTEGG